MNMFGDAVVWPTKYQAMTLVFIMPGTSQVQEKQLTNYSAKLVILMMFCVIKL